MQNSRTGKRVRPGDDEGNAQSQGYSRSVNPIAEIPLEGEDPFWKTPEQSEGELSSCV